MRNVLIAMWIGVAVGACAEVDDPSISDHESAVSQLIGEKLDNLVPGPIGGQNGWTGNCVVTPDTVGNYLKCVGDRYATKPIGFHGAGSYTMLVDLGPNGQVVDSTHGKISLEGPAGRVFQIIVGCDNIRVAAQMNGATAQLAAFPCGSLTGPPSYRVVCHWSSQTEVLSCGATRLPHDPERFVDLALPSRPFDSVAIMTFPRAGASLFDKIYVWRN